MKIVYISVNLVSYPQLKYLLAVAFLVATSFGSDEVDRPSRTGGSQPFVYEEFRKLKKEFETLRTTVRASELTKGGALYIRWGRNVCPHGSEVVHTGVAGGSWFDHHGGGSNYLCLPLQPIWGSFNTGVEKQAKIYGSEYQEPSGFGLNNNHYLPLQNNNVPCVVCRSQTRSSVMTVPARNKCYSGWNTEYTGYLMTEKHSHRGRTEFVCMDGQPETVPNGYRDENGALFYNVEGVCGSLPCPPYVARRELTCAVCTK